MSAERDDHCKTEVNSISSTETPNKGRLHFFRNESNKGLSKALSGDHCDSDPF